MLNRIFIIIITLIQAISLTTFTCIANANEVTEDEIFQLYKPDYQDEEPIILDFGTDLVKIDANTTISDERSIKDLRKQNIDIDLTIEQEPEIDAFEELVNDGLLALNKGHYEAADVLYRKALKFDPDNNDIFFAIGYANQMMGKNNIAKDYYKKVLKNDKFYEKAFQNYFTILAYENPSFTIKKLREMVQTNPYHPVILSQLGSTYFSINNMQLALRYFLRALQMDPDNAHYNYKTAIIYEQLKDFETASEFYNNTLKYMDDVDDIELNRQDIIERIRYLGQI